MSYHVGQIDFNAVSELTGLKPPAARMRYTRLKKGIESGSIFSSSPSQTQSGFSLGAGAGANPSANSAAILTTNNNNIGNKDSIGTDAAGQQIFFPPTDITRDTQLRKRKRSSTTPIMASLAMIEKTKTAKDKTENGIENGIGIDDFEVIQTRSGSRIARAKEGEGEHVYVEGNPADDEHEDVDDDDDHSDDNPNATEHECDDDAGVVEDASLRNVASRDSQSGKEVVGSGIDVKTGAAQKCNDNIQKEEQDDEDEDDLPLITRRIRARGLSGRFDILGLSSLNGKAPSGLTSSSLHEENGGALKMDKKTESRKEEEQLLPTMKRDQASAGGQQVVIILDSDS